MHILQNDMFFATLCKKLNLHIFYLCNLYLRQHCVIDLYQFGINAQITIVLLITKANFHHFLPIYYTMICYMY